MSNWDDPSFFIQLLPSASPPHELHHDLTNVISRSHNDDGNPGSSLACKAFPDTTPNHKGDGSPAMVGDHSGSGNIILCGQTLFIADTAQCR
jgi:hypothetical protein